MHITLGRLILLLTLSATLGGVCTVGLIHYSPRAKGEELQKHSDYIASLSTSFNRASQAVEPSVVYLTTLDVDDAGDAYSQMSGSGVIIDPEGYILTNYHVVGMANRIKVRLSDGRLLSGSIVGVDQETDLAVVKVSSPRPLPVAKIGDSERVMVGEWVLAIGSPFGLQQTVTAGIISAKERVTDNRRTFQQMLQTDASINPGNSGGPLINLAGEVIGINTQIATKTGGFQGIGFAVPSAIFVDVYNQIVHTGRVSRGYLGIYSDRVSPQFREVYSLPNSEGALIHDITEPDGPAARAGLKSGDVIIEFDGHKIKDDRDLVRRIVVARLDTEIEVKYIRAGKIQRCSVRLVERDAPVPVAVRRTPMDTILGRRPRLERTPTGRETPEQTVEMLNERIGISIAPLSPMRARALGYAETRGGVVVRAVQNNSVAYDAGLRDGDLLLEVNRQPIVSEQDYVKALKQLKSGDSVVFFTEQRVRGTTTTRRYRSLNIP